MDKEGTGGCQGKRNRVGVRPVPKSTNLTERHKRYLKEGQKREIEGTVKRRDMVKGKLSEEA